MEMNCPNCGAPLVGGRCEYCGTLSPDAEEKIRELRRQMDEFVSLGRITQWEFITRFPTGYFDSKCAKEKE